MHRGAGVVAVNDHDCFAVGGVGGGRAGLCGEAWRWGAGEELLGDVVGVFGDEPLVWRRRYHTGETGLDLWDELCRGLVGLCDVDLVDAVPGEDLAVDEDVASVSAGRGDMLFDPVGALVKRERILGWEVRVLGRDPDVIRHRRILGGVLVRGAGAHVSAAFRGKRGCGPPRSCELRQRELCARRALLRFVVVSGVSGGLGLSGADLGGWVGGWVGCLRQVRGLGVMGGEVTGRRPRSCVGAAFRGRAREVIWSVRSELGRPLDDQFAAEVGGGCVFGLSSPAYDTDDANCSSPCGGGPGRTARVAM